MKLCPNDEQLCDSILEHMWTYIYVARFIPVGSCIAGIAQCVTLGGCSLLSVAWFPANQRNTATSISSLSFIIGMAIAYVAGRCT